MYLYVDVTNFNKKNYLLFLYNCEDVEASLSYRSEWKHDQGLKQNIISASMDTNSNNVYHVKLEPQGALIAHQSTMITSVIS